MTLCKKVGDVRKKLNFECMNKRGVGSKNLYHFFKMFVKSSLAKFSVHFKINVQCIFMFFSQYLICIQPLSLIVDYIVM